MKELARQLFVLESKQSATSDFRINTLNILEKLRVPISRVAGAGGYSSLLMRALSMATAELQILKVVQVKSDGVLTGLTTIEESEELSNTKSHLHPGVTILSHFLNLLDTFIGKSITITLLREAWPEESFDISGQSPRKKT